jgi:hypothetical protein
MKHLQLLLRLFFLSILVIVSACGNTTGQAQDTPVESGKTAAGVHNMPSTLPTGGQASQQEDAWAQVRSIIPGDVTVYKPTFVPDRFGAPTLEEASSEASGVPVYTVVYTAPDETVAFILNTGKGALGNFPPTESPEEPIQVGGMDGSLSIASESDASGIFWEVDGQNYQVKAFSKQITKDELLQIANSVTPVE